MQGLDKRVILRQRGVADKGLISIKRLNDYYDLALKVWNEEKLPNWTYHRGLTDRAKGQVKKILEFFGEEEFEEAIHAAISHAKKNDFWKNGSFSFANLFSNDKGIEYAEKEMNNAPEIVVGGLYRMANKPGWIARVKASEGKLFSCTIAQYGNVEETMQDVELPRFEIGERIHEKQRSD